jgi:hypothetical protein
MSGFQEILLIVIILLAIFFIPRMTARNAARPPMRPAVRRPPRQLGSRWRLAILASAIWLCGALLYFRPWEGEWVRFGAIGALPVGVAWGLYWVFAGSPPRDRSGRSVNRRS